MVKTNGCLALGCDQNPRSHQEVPLQAEEGDRYAHPLLSPKKAAAGKKVTANTNIYFGSSAWE